jgi:hypothetical protein
MSGHHLGLLDHHLDLGTDAQAYRKSRDQPPITAAVSRGRCITLDGTCLDGGAGWDGCLLLSGTSCGICGRLVSRSGRQAAGWVGHRRR